MNHVEQALGLSVFFLKRHGFFDVDSKFGGTQWSRMGRETGSVNFQVSKVGMRVQLLYKVTNSFTGEGQEMDYEVPLLRTRCHFGGCRYWFQCLGCYRRVAVLYFNTFARCRKCSRLYHEAQSYSLTLRRHLFYKMARVEGLGNRMRALRRRAYNSRPTKRWKRLEKRLARLKEGF